MQSEAQRERSRRGGRNRAKQLAGGDLHPATSQREYDDEEREWLAAVMAWQKKTGRRFPTMCDFLQIAKSLGYRKAEGQ